MAATTAASAVELQEALAANLARLKRAQNYIVRLRASGGFEAAFEIMEAEERIDELLLERLELRARL